MAEMKDLTGLRFGYLLAIEIDKERVNKELERWKKREIKHRPKTFWRCKCDCGNESTVTITHLLNGKTVSCGCLRKEKSEKIGKSNTKTNYYEELKDCYRGWDIKNENCFYISKEDYDLVKNYCWCKNKHGYWTAKSKDKTLKERIKLHQIIAKQIQKDYTPNSKIVPDHIDRDKSNNRRENLEIKNRSGNARNTTTRKDNTSGKQGVHWHKTAKKWCVQIYDENKKRLYLFYDDFDEAVSKRIELEKEFGYIGE